MVFSTPRWSLGFSNKVLLNGLVKMSATWSWIGMNVT